MGLYFLMMKKIYAYIFYYAYNDEVVLMYTIYFLCYKDFLMDCNAVELKC